MAVYEPGGRGVHAPVRVHGDEERDLLVLQSDVPVSAAAATEFAGCVTGWLAEQDATPVYLSGRAAEREADAAEPPALSGVGTGAVADRLEKAGVPAPDERGVISGPTGALLAAAAEQGLDAAGLVVEAHERFPDPEAARVVLTDGVKPLAGVTVDTAALVDRADKVAAARERLAERMGEAEEASSRAQPVGMFQ